MRVYGIQLAEGSSLTNATIASGTEFPDAPSAGELFLRSDTLTLHFYDGTDWKSLVIDTGSGGGGETLGGYMYARQQETAGTGAGAGPGSAGTEFTRVLNTVVSNDIVGASLLSDTITLPPGKYYFDATVPGSTLQSKIQSVSGTSVLLYGPQFSTSAGRTTTAGGRIVGVATLSQETEIQLISKSTIASPVLGDTGSIFLEIYSQIEIWKMV